LTDDNSTPATAADTQTTDDDGRKKRAKPISLAQKTGRVTVIFPPKNQ